jgi:DNA invertase Pin-like site-specific DNA recombinase
MKVLAYLRVSSKGQIDGDGFPRQREAIQKWSETPVTEEFVEEGVSGTTDLMSRPALSRLFAAVSSGDIVVVEKADRLARDLIVSEVLLRQFRDLGVTVIEAESGNDLTENDNPTAKLIRQILAAVSEFDKSSIVRKLKAAKDRIRTADGRCEGRKPFGFHPQEAPTLKRMIALRDEGYRMQEIADVLNGDGVPTRTGKPWSYGSVAKIVSRNTETPDELKD